MSKSGGKIKASEPILAAAKAKVGEEKESARHAKDGRYIDRHPSKAKVRYFQKR